MHARFLLAASGLAITYAQDIFSGCLNPESSSCDLTPLFQAGEDVAKQCEAWTSLSTDPCTQSCSEEDKALLAQFAAVTCGDFEFPTDPYETDLPSELDDLLGLLPSCASECELVDEQSPDAICTALTSCEAACESELDLDLLDSLTSAICDLADIPSDLPTNLDDLIGLIPSCAEQCGDELFQGTCGDPETCEYEMCGDVPCQFCGIYPDGSCCSSNADDEFCFGDFPGLTACPAPCTDFSDPAPSDICNALTSCETGCEDQIDLDLLQGVTDAICALADAVPENPECAANCAGYFLGSDPTDVCGNAEATLECIVAECTDQDIIDLFQGIADQACALPEPPTCAAECQSALPDGAEVDPNALPCDTATDFASCLDTSCGSEDPLTDLANQLKDVACSLPPLPDIELPEIPTEIPMCVSGCVENLPTDPTKLCEGMGSFSQCVNRDCGEQDVFALLAAQLEQLACDVEPPACAFDCAEDVDPTPPTSADAICSSLTDTTSCLDEGCGDDEPIFKFVFDAAKGIACDIAAIPTELPVCAEECIDPDLADTGDICAAVEENFVCIEVACGEEYDIVLDLLNALREFGCNFDDVEPTPPAPTPAPQVAEAEFVLEGQNLATQFSVESFENALSSASGATVEVESVKVVSAVTLSGADFDGVFTEDQQTQCRQGYADNAGVSVDLVIILNFSFERRRLDAGDLSVEIQTTASPDEVENLLQSTTDNESLSQAFVTAGLSNTGVTQEVETITPKATVESAEGGLEQVLNDPNFGNALQDELAQGGLDVDNIDTSFDLVNNNSDDDDEWELYVIIAGACVGTALLAGGVGMFIGSRRNEQRDTIKSAEMRSSKAEPNDMF